MVLNLFRTNCWRGQCAVVQRRIFIHHTRMGPAGQTKTMKKIAFMLLAAGVLIFSGCTKTGPPGPQGVQGPQGPQGNANVIGSDPFTVSAWSKDGNTYYAQFNSPDISKNIAEYGVVSMFKYYDLGFGEEWSPLPDINGNVSTVFNFYTNGFTIYVQNTDGTTTAHPGSQTFRMVTIAPALKQAHPNTDWRNYQQVMKVLNEKTEAPVSSMQ